MFFSTEKIGVLYIHGRQSCAQISRADGRSETTIYNILKQRGTQMRSRSEANQAFPDFIFIGLYNIGLSCTQVGKLLDVHPTTVIKRFELKKFPLRGKEVASAIRYSNSEFKNFFEDESFSKNLFLLKLATTGYLEDMIDA